MEPLLTAYLLDARALMPNDAHCSHRVYCQQVGDWDGESGRTHSGTKAFSDSPGGTASHVKSFQTSELSGTCTFTCDQNQDEVRPTDKGTSRP